VPGPFNPAYDQLSSALAEGFLAYADDNFFRSTAIIARMFEEAERTDEARFIAANIITSDNPNAGVFGPTDPVTQDSVSIISTAAFPWSWYVCSIQLDYQTLRLNQGRNLRLNLVATQLQNGLASIVKNASLDFGQSVGLSQPAGVKGRNFGTGQNAFSIIDASDDGTVVNVYGGISRQGAGAYPFWSGYDIRTLAQNSIGTASNNPAWKYFTNLYQGCSIGDQAPTDVFSTRAGVAAYMNIQAPNQRVSPGDEMQIGFSAAFLFNAYMFGDDYVYFPQNNGTPPGNGANFYALNIGHTHCYYAGKKGFDFIPWMDSQQGAVTKIARYIMLTQLLSTQPRLNGQLLFLNDITTIV
jgi:hypothetical protein